LRDEPRAAPPGDGRTLYERTRFGERQRVRVLKLLGVFAVVAIAAFIGVGLVLPNRWQVERDVKIAAPLPVVQARIAKLKEWPAWASTSVTTDPQAVFSWDGVDGEVGSAMRWSGPKLGRGTLTLVEVVDGVRVAFDGAIESDVVNARSIFKLSHEAGVTTVRWEDEGATPPIVGGYMRGFVEAALAAHIEASLAALKKGCEQVALTQQAAVPTTASAAALTDGGTP
jgi:Polyketide cyclase / dehydrase and lipid transport